MTTATTRPPTVHSTTAPSRPSGPAPTVPYLATFRWSWRLLRRGTLIMWFVVALYMAVEVISFRTAYPDQAARERLLELSTSSAVRMMQGVPSAVDTAGGFAIWDGGWVLMLIVGTWAILTTTRLTRGEEDTGRAELLLSRPLQSPQVLTMLLAAFAVTLTGIGVAASVPLIAMGEPALGAVLWGLALATFGAAMTAVGVLCAQAFEPRRRASSVGLSLMTAAFLLRVVANSADSRDWILSFTPFGWTDRIRAFGENNVPWLLAPALATITIAFVALRLSSRRDTGAALVASSSSRRSRLHLLRGATSFGWRLTSGALIAWSIALGISSVVFGLMTGAIVDFIQKDDTYRRMLEAMGMDMSVPIIGFLSYMASYTSIAFAMFVGWRIGAFRQEEAEGRLDNLLVRGVVRWRLLTSTAVLAVGAGALLILISGVGLWAGATLVDAKVTVGQVAEPMAGTLTIVVLFVGIAVLTYGLVPRLTTAVPVTLAVLTFLLETFGQILKWPDVIVGASPFNHLARLPASPLTVTAAVVMTTLGLATAAIGIIAFARRDLKGT